MKMEKENIRRVWAFYDFLDEGKPELLRAYLAPEAKFYYESGDPVTFDKMEPMIKMFYASFPDYHHRIEDIIASDDKVVVRLTYEGTFTHPFMEMKPNGAKFKYRGIQIFQFLENKVINFWAVEDELALMQQLGMELTSKELVH